MGGDATSTPPVAGGEEEISHDDLCPVCTLLLYKPVKTQCNHVLCGSCMVQWADISATAQLTPSNLDLDLSDFDPNASFSAHFSTLEANCPMCRTHTTAETDEVLAGELERKYPKVYAQRKAEEEATRPDHEREQGIERVTILIGNQHRVVRPQGSRSDANQHDWTFFVRVSRPEIIDEVRVELHPTFRPPRVVLSTPPYEVRRLGWGIFNLEAKLVLKEGYTWVKDGQEEDSGRRRRGRRGNVLPLDWMLSFEGEGMQGRVRAKVRKVGDGDGN